MGFIHFRTKKASRPTYIAELKQPIFAEDSFPLKLDSWQLRPEFYLNLMRRAKDYYRTVEHQKSNGSPRYISVPSEDLLVFQQFALSNGLSSPKLFHSAAYAYIAGKSSNDCARQHIEATWLIKIDISNFFHQIDERRIYREFLNRHLDKFESFALARFLTRVTENKVEWLPRKYRLHRKHSLSSKFGVTTKQLGFLPQGSPTSGAISNLVCFDLDNAISKITFPHGLTYTRYADDLIISGSKGFDRELAESILKQVMKVVRSEHFEVNSQKTRIIPPGARMRILGVLVGGGRMRLPVDTRKHLDGQLRAIEKFGFKKHAKFANFKNEAALLNHVYGYLVWAKDVNDSWAIPRLEKLRQLAESQLGDVL